MLGDKNNDFRIANAIVLVYFVTLLQMELHFTFAILLIQIANMRLHRMLYEKTSQAENFQPFYRHPHYEYTHCACSTQFFDCSRILLYQKAAHVM